MYKFGEKSLSRLKTCHPDIQVILNELIKIYDFNIIEGIRSTQRHQELFNANKSKLDGIIKKSKHQAMLMY